MHCQHMNSLFIKAYSLCGQNYEADLHCKVVGSNPASPPVFCVSCFVFIGKLLQVACTGELSCVKY